MATHRPPRFVARPRPARGKDIEPWLVFDQRKGEVVSVHMRLDDANREAERLNRREDDADGFFDYYSS